MTTSIHFNTSRLYCRHGQRITVQVGPDGTVLFNDHSRMIGGQIITIPVPFPNARTLADYVMHYYDLHQYTPSVEALLLAWDPTQEHLFRI